MFTKKTPAPADILASLKNAGEQRLNFLNSELIRLIPSIDNRTVAGGMAKNERDRKENILKKGERLYFPAYLLPVGRQAEDVKNIKKLTNIINEHELIQRLNWCETSAEYNNLCQANRESFKTKPSFIEIVNNILSNSSAPSNVLATVSSHDPNSLGSAKVLGSSNSDFLVLMMSKEAKIADEIARKRSEQKDIIDRIKDNKTNMMVGITGLNFWLAGECEVLLDLKIPSRDLDNVLMCAETLIQDQKELEESQKRPIKTVDEITRLQRASTAVINSAIALQKAADKLPSGTSKFKTGLGILCGLICIGCLIGGILAMPVSGGLSLLAGISFAGAVVSAFAGIGLVSSAPRSGASARLFHVASGVKSEAEKAAKEQDVAFNKPKTP